MSINTSNKFFVIIMVFLFIGTSIGSISANLTVDNQIKPYIPKEQRNMGDPPTWAMGTFNGTYGFLKHGNPSLELGRFEGYWESNIIGYSYFEKGRLQGVFFENETLIPIWNFSANVFSKHKSTYMSTIFFGRLSNLQEDNTYFLFGIGKQSFDGTLESKIFTVLGDNYYLSGEWKRFDLVFP
jgi:hypothetical protein